jgi:serine/threonine protein kinase
LVAADGSPRLAGFDVSNIMVESNPTFPYQPGAVRWAAPELFVPQEVRCTTKSSDIYSLGCIMLEVSALFELSMTPTQHLQVYGATPYWWIGLIHGVIAAKFAYREPINNTLHIPAYYRDFMRQCWSIKYECRPVVEEVLDFLEEAICVRLGSELVFFFFFFIVTPSLYIQKHAGTYS